MSKTRVTEQTINTILKFIGSGISRKDLIRECTKSELSPSELKRKQPGGPYAKCTGKYGYAINSLIETGVIAQDSEKFITLLKQREEAIEVVRRDDKIRTIIQSLIKNKSYSKKDLLLKVVEEFFKQNRDTEATKQSVKSDAGRIYSDLVKSGEISADDDAVELIKPNNGAPQIITKDTLYGMSDEDFVNRSIELLIKYCESCGLSDIEGANIDGSDDGGIDGVITANDALGYKENIIMQVKHVNVKNKNHIKICEIMEFCGVLAAKDGATRGIFITNVSFNENTKKFAKSFKTKYFVLIDGDKWVQLAEKLNYRIVNDN